MLILGIDPGLATIGFGYVRKIGEKYRAEEYGAITTKPRIPVEKRLSEIYDSVTELLNARRPDCISIMAFPNTHCPKRCLVCSASILWKR